MGKVKIREIGNARGFFTVTSPFGVQRVAGKSNAVDLGRSLRRLIKKKALINKKL